MPLTITVFLFCFSKPAFATILTCCFSITLQSSQSNLSAPNTMAAIKSLMTRDSVAHQLVKRQNWASKEAGVIVVFCIVGVVAIGLLSLFLYKKAAARKANKASAV
ncbi:hypothetical protein FVEN_g8567 [Fusarium venenatum]|nr:hypothetical protein FVEN_g8567 [Fusarium venenatum]